MARSHDGVSDCRIDARPGFAPDLSKYRDEAWGVEDARLTWVEDRDQWIIAYAAFSPSRPLVCLATAQLSDLLSYLQGCPAPSRPQGKEVTPCD